MRFWSWLVFAASGVTLNLIGGRPFPEFGIGVLFAGSLFAPPLSEFQRRVSPHDYPSILVFVFLAPASLVALAMLSSSRFVVPMVPASLIGPFKAALLGFWTWVALREFLRFRRILTAGAA
jgi:hypothetical protein